MMAVKTLVIDGRSPKSPKRPVISVPVQYAITGASLSYYPIFISLRKTPKANFLPASSSYIVSDNLYYMGYPSSNLYHQLMISSQDGKFDVSKCRPAIPYPFEVPKEERIKKLEEYLENKILQHQRANIEFVINMYRTRQLKSLLGPPNRKGIYIYGGKVYDNIPNSKERKDLLVWFEVRSSIRIIRSMPDSGVP